jgi:hypothetical protein
MTENHGQFCCLCGTRHGSWICGMWFGETCTFFPKIKQTSMGCMYFMGMGSQQVLNNISEHIPMAKWLKDD